MRLIVTQDRDGQCEVWKEDATLTLNTMGMFIPRPVGKLVGRLQKKFCRNLFGFVPRPKTAVMVEVSKLRDKVYIKKQKVNKKRMSG